MSTRKRIKVPPHSKESEMMVLGSMLTNPNSVQIGSEALEEDDFYYAEHCTIFICIKTLFENDKPADIHLVSEKLKKIDQLDAVGGIPYLVTLVQFAGTSVYVEEYAALIKDKSITRKLIKAAMEVEKLLLDDPDDIREAIDNIQEKFHKISKEKKSGIGVSAKEIYGKEDERTGVTLKYELEHGRVSGTSPNIQTGFTDLDKILYGLAPQNLIIVAGRPAMGKTAFALSVVENVCFKQDIPTGVFSLEMSNEELGRRMACSLSEVPVQKVVENILTFEDKKRNEYAIKKIEKSSIIIDDTKGLKITELMSRARRMKESNGIKLLIVDYLQLISGSYHTAKENRQQEISEISRKLKQLAGELDTPIICMAQLSRKTEERADNRPIMSDLRESGAIEQDADVVLMLLRKDYYKSDSDPGEAELIIGKNRHGGTGSIKLVFRKDLAKFASKANGYY